MPRRNPTSSGPDIHLEDLADLDEEGRLKRAVQAILVSRAADNEGPKLEVRAAARLYDVKRGTLTNRLNGVRPRSEAHAHERMLAGAEEEVLSEWIRSLGRRGIPVTINVLREYASVC